MNKDKLENIIECAELIQKLTTLISVPTAISSRRIKRITDEAEMIIQLSKSLKDKDE